MTKVNNINSVSKYFNNYFEYNMLYKNTCFNNIDSDY